MEIKFKCVHFSELTIYELYAAMALRQEIFSVEQNCAYLDADGKDFQGFHLLGYADLSELNIKNLKLGENTEGVGISDFKFQISSSTVITQRDLAESSINLPELVAYTRLLPKGVSYEYYASIGRVVNSSKVRGQGVGKLLMEESIRQMARLFPNEPVKIGAQTYLLKFYTSLGFQSTGEEYLEDNIPHTSMILTK
jgi:ElaA protein